MELINILKDLVKIDTRNPPGITTEAVEYLQRIFSSFRTKVRSKVNGKENLIVDVFRGKPTILLTSHLDTVPSDDILLNPIIVNGKLYGRGSCDAKGCVAAICCAVLGLDDLDIGLKVAFTSDEEVGGSNGLAFVFEKEKADYVLIGEPTGCDSVGVLQASVLSLNINFKGKSGHTATKLAINGAIARASKYILERIKLFNNLYGNFSKFENYFKNLGFHEFKVKTWHAVFNPSLIKGGIKRNVVAPSCTIYADIRFAPWISVDEVRRMLVIDDAEFEVEGFLSPYGPLCDRVNPKSDGIMLKNLVNAIKNNSITPKAVFSLGVGDSRHVRKFGVPAFYYGPGGEDIHGENEFVYVSELFMAVKVYKSFLKLMSESLDLTTDE